VLGVSKATRVPLLANVPTIAEQGVTGFESGTWQGVLVPAGTPPAIVARLSAELTKIIRSPEVRSRLTVQGAEVYTMSPTEFAPFFETERKRKHKFARLKIHKNGMLLMLPETITEDDMKRFKKVAAAIFLKALEIDSTLTVHGFRRTYNNLMRQAVQDTILVQSMTGHSSDEMTEHYSSVSLQEKQDALQKLFDHLRPGLAAEG